MNENSQKQENELTITKSGSLESPTTAVSQPSDIPIPLKHPGGRPTDYRPEYCQSLEEHMKKGLSFESFGAIANCSEDTLHEWKKKHPEFAESYKKGQSYSRNFWEELGMVGTTEGNHFNAPTWIFNMKNRFKWTDRHDVTSNDKELPTPILGGITSVHPDDSHS